jgi:hypothetical protein
MKKKMVFIAIIFLMIFFTGGSKMADENIQMGQRNANNTAWDNLYPITKAENIIANDTDTLSKYVEKMLLGQAVQIGCYGDSTYWGAMADGVTRVAEPPIVTLQTLLRSYYNNNLIVCVNNGHNGFQTSSALSGADGIAPWEEIMATNTDDIVIIGYGINDCASWGVTMDVYRANMRELVKIALKHGKVVVIDTPNIVLKMTNGLQAEKVKQAAQIGRDIAMEFNVALIDNFARTTEYLQTVISTDFATGGGVHPTVPLYKFKGTQMASAFISPKLISTDDECIIPCYDSAFKFSGTSSYMPAYPNSKVGYCIMASYIKLAIYVDKPNMDVYLATGTWLGGHSEFNVVLDNTVVKTMSVYDSNYADYFMHDAETLVIKNLTKGFHIIEFNKTDSSIGSYVDCYYVKLKENKRIKQTPTASLSNFKQIVKSYDGVQLTFSSTTVPYVLTDIPTSRILDDIDIEFATTLHINEGFLVMGSKNSAGNITCGLMIMAPTSSEISIYENIDGNVYSGSILNTSATSYIGTAHTFRFVVSKTGTATLYCDGVSIGTYTMTRNLTGGYLGFYKNGVGTMTVKNINIYE